MASPISTTKFTSKSGHPYLVNLVGVGCTSVSGEVVDGVSNQRVVGFWYCKRMWWNSIRKGWTLPHGLETFVLELLKN